MKDQFEDLKQFISKNSQLFLDWETVDILQCRENIDDIIETLRKANDDILANFFDLHWATFIEAGIPDVPISCVITIHAYSTSFELNTFYIFDKLISAITAAGPDEDMLDSLKNQTLLITDCKDLHEHIKMFKEECDQVYTCNGEFSVKQCEDGGSYIKYYE